MIDLITKDECQFTNDGIEARGIIYKDHIGCTKLCRWGEPSLLETISARVGRKKAKEILNKSSQRGNRIHTKMETQWHSILNEDDLARLGAMAGVEVLLSGGINGINCLGFADAIFYNETTKIYTILDYKTKSSKHSWNTYGDMEKYWMQLASYAILFNDFYKQGTAIEVATFVLFKDGSDYLPYYSDLKGLMPYAKKVIAKTNLINS